MKEEVGQAVEAILTHPKSTLAVTGLANFNVWWMDYGEPIIKVATSVLGLAVLTALLAKHVLDTVKTYRELKNDKD